MRMFSGSVWSGLFAIEDFLSRVMLMNGEPFVMISEWPTGSLTQSQARSPAVKTRGTAHYTTDKCAVSLGSNGTSRKCENLGREWAFFMSMWFAPWEEVKDLPWFSRDDTMPLEHGERLRKVDDLLWSLRQ